MIILFSYAVCLSQLPASEISKKLAMLVERFVSSTIGILYIYKLLNAHSRPVIQCNVAPNCRSIYYLWLKSTTAS